MKKVMVIGLGPEYNYPGHFLTWKGNNTRYASNHGASLISRTLLKMFDADFIDDFSKVEEYKRQYELCVIAFATHATDWRDVSEYANFIEALDIPTSLFSLGIQDYADKAGNVGALHPSLIRILDHVSNTTKLLGVRGFHTASLLYKEGYSNVIPIGCPTLYNGMNRELRIDKSATYSNPINVFHRTISDVSLNFVNDVTLLGQDFLDEVIFTDNFNDDPVRATELKKFAKHRFGDQTLVSIQKNGVFHKTFDEWNTYLSNSDFVFGPRLHGCISALIKGIPALMVARDIRVKEIAEFFKIPVLPYEMHRNQTLKELYDGLDYSQFNDLYPKRYDNFISFLNESGIINYYKKPESGKGINFSFEDLQANRACAYQKIDNLNRRLAVIEERTEPFSFKKKVRRPIVRKIKKIIGS